MATTIGQEELIVIVVVPITGCLLIVIFASIIYCCCCRKREDGSVKSPFHKDRRKQHPNIDDETPVKDNSIKRHTQSVEYTFFNSTGEVEEIKGYSDEDLKTSGQNGHVTREDTRIYEVNQTGGDLEDDVKMRGNAGHQSTESGRRTPDDYLRMSALSAASEASYVVPDVPENHYVAMNSKKEDDDGYIKPKDFGLDDDYVNTQNVDISDDYVNTQNVKIDDDYVNTQNVNFNDDYVNTKNVDVNKNRDDGYIKPDPATDGEESEDYSYAALPKGVDLSNMSKEHQYVNQRK